MSHSARLHGRSDRQLWLIASLFLATCLCVALLFLRVAHSQSLAHWSLLWNLFLAWLPMLSALIAYNLRGNRSPLSWGIASICALAWLAFFPNSPYLVTDVIHLWRDPGAVPLWYDLLLVVSFAWTGCFLGLASLFLMQALVREKAGRVAGWTVAGSALTLSGFGVYIGRFLRWNSWDILTNPAPLLWDIIERVRHPLAHLQAYGFSALFSLFLICAYLMLVSVAGFHSADAAGDIVPER